MLVGDDLVVTVRHGKAPDLASVRRLMEAHPELLGASDVAGAVLFLCSHAADYIHGVIIPVDGGWLAR